MAVIKLPCPHCHRVCAIDSSKLPSRPIAFNCPGCGGKVIVDPAKLGLGEPLPAPPPPAPAPPAEEPAVLPAAGNEVTDVELPPGTTLPRGVVVGDNRAPIEELKRALEPYGGRLDVMANLAEVTAMPPEEVPALLVCVTGTASRPPLDLLRPLLGLVPVARRRTFVVLVADNLTTLDGNQAFFYQVNLVLATRDVARAAPLLYSALQYQRRLFGPLLQAIEEREGEE